MEKSNIFLKRIVFIFLLSVLILLCIFVLPSWSFALLIMFFIALGLNEFFNLIIRKNIPVYKNLSIIIGLMIPFLIFIRFKPTEEWTLALALLAFIILFISYFIKGNHSNAILGISATLFGLIYISWLCSYLIKIKEMPNGSSLILFLLLVTKLGDSGAYLIGKRFGKHKLLSRVSPNKSIEGAISGFLVSLLVAISSAIYLPQIPLIHLILLGFLLGVTAQLGDLAESLIKRNCDSKDSGNFIPSQGGVLDLIDSILFSAPVLYLYVKIVL